MPAAASGVDGARGPAIDDRPAATPAEEILEPALPPSEKTALFSATASRIYRL